MQQGGPEENCQRRGVQPSAARNRSLAAAVLGSTPHQLEELDMPRPEEQDTDLRGDIHSCLVQAVAGRPQKVQAVAEVPHTPGRVGRKCGEGRRRLVLGGVAGCWLLGPQVKGLIR
jgi:hypothetical protein